MTIKYGHPIRTALALALACGAGAAGVATATATADTTSATTATASAVHFYNGYVGPKRGFASTGAGGNVRSVRIVTDHTACPAVLSGERGHFDMDAVVPSDRYYSYSPGACGIGTSDYVPPYSPFVEEAAIFNFNVSTTVAVSDASYTQF